MSAFDKKINTIIYDTYYLGVNENANVFVNEENVKNMLDVLFLNESVFRDQLFNEETGVTTIKDLTTEVKYMSFENDSRNCRLNAGFNIFLNYGLKRGFMELGAKERSKTELNSIKDSLATYLKHVFNYLMDRNTEKKTAEITYEEIKLVESLRIKDQSYNKIYLSEACLMYIVFLIISYANAAFLCKDYFLSDLNNPVYAINDLSKFFEFIYYKGYATAVPNENRFYAKQPINDGISCTLDRFMKTFYDDYVLTTNEAPKLVKQKTLDSIPETNKFFMKNYDGSHANVIYQSLDDYEWLKIDDTDQNDEKDQTISFADFKIVKKNFETTNVNQTVKDHCEDNNFRPITDFVTFKGGVVNKYIVAIIALLILVIILIVVIIIVLNKNKNLNSEIDKLKDKEEV